MSLFEYYSSDPISVMNDFRMSVNHPNYEDITLYVEGKTDIKLLRGLVNEEVIKLIPLKGKKNVIRVMKGLYSSYAGKVYAVCDADFDHIPNECIERLDYGVFITDYHDIEVMMILSSAMNKVLDQRVKDNNINFYKKILEEVINVCRVIGLLRFINFDKDFGLNFKAMNFNNFIVFDQSGLTLDFDILIEKLIEISPSQRVNEMELKSYYSQYLVYNYDSKQLCCGHDCTNVLAIYFNSSDNIDGKNFNKNRVEEDLMLAFNDYDKYSVFNNIKRLA